MASKVGVSPITDPRIGPHIIAERGRQVVKIRNDLRYSPVQFLKAVKRASWFGAPEQDVCARVRRLNMVQSDGCGLFLG